MMSPMASLELAVIITVPLAVILVIIVLLAIYCVCYWSYCRTRRVANNQTFCRLMCVTNNRTCHNGGEERSDIERNEMFTDHITPEAIVPQGETLSNLMSSESRGITTGLSLLVQRSLVSRTKIIDHLGAALFYQLYLGMWRKEQVLVKLYNNDCYSLWRNEMTVYQVPLLKHQNILSFLAAGSKPTGTAANYIGHYTLLEYCHPVTMSEHLQENSLSLDHMISCVTDVLRGLSHLHSDVSKGSLTKPVIAHCQLTSDNIIVNTEGKCSIWNFELAISNSSESYPVNYYQYYCLSPELLLQLDSEVDLHCCVLSDVYAIGLLMWQMSKRCSLYGTFEEYEVPYQMQLCSSHPTRCEVTSLVCEQHYRPQPPQRLMATAWYVNSYIGDRDHDHVVLDGYLLIMTTCWHQQQQCTSLELYKQLTELARGGVIDKKTSNETCSSCCINDYTIKTTISPNVTEAQ